MKLIDKIRERILKFLKLDRLTADPNGERFVFVSDPDEIGKQEMEECRIWYLGDSNKLLNFYTNQSVYGFAKEPIYDRNRANYFWGISPKEANIKRVHSGVPRAIVDTLTNVIGMPQITATKDGKSYDLSKMISETNLREIMMQQQIPLTMAIGWGAFKVIIPKDRKLNQWPIVRFYEAKDVELAVRDGFVVGVIFKDYYTEKKKDYVLLTTCRINDKGNSAVEYELFRLKQNDEVDPCDLSEIPALDGLESVEFPEFRGLFGIPSRFIYDPDRPNYGKSIYAGKIDLFDDLDQSLSQRSQTSRVSTPVEYYSPDVLERGPNGRVSLPKVYNRQFIAKSSIPDGDGVRDDSIQTTQPMLNFDQYSREQLAILDFILIGILSPATMGIDLAKKDNADAQREKEKVTIMTRNNIIEQETKIVRDLIKTLIAAKEYMDSGEITDDSLGWEISVKFDEFANPTFESMARSLIPVLSSGAMSIEMFIDKLYGDSLSQEEKAKEIERLTQMREASMLSEADFEE